MSDGKIDESTDSHFFLNKTYQTTPLTLKIIFLNIIKRPLLRHILIISIGGAIFFPVYISYFIFPQFVNQLTNYTQDAAVRVTKHLTDTIFVKGRDLTRQSFTSDVETEVLKVKKDLRLEKIKVFSASGEVLFSSDPKDIGNKNDHDYFYTQIAREKIYSKVVQKNTRTLEGRLVDVEVVESYVPVMTEGAFSGAIEVYYDITDNRDELTVLLNRIKRTMMAFSVMFIIVMFIILFKASRNILERDIAELSLQKTHSDLEKKVAQRTADLKKANQYLTIEIEEHQMADKALRRSERQLRAILEANPDPMVMYDPNGHPLYTNPSFTALFGWSLDELKGKRIPFVPEDQKERSAEKIEEIYTRGMPLTFETKRLTKDNRILDVILSAAVIKNRDDEPIGMVVNLTNISDKKALEIQYKQAQRLESIGTLAGGIAHDFNNILSGIFGYAQLAEVNIKDPVKTKQNLEQIIKAAKRAAELVQQILTFSRQSDNKKQPLRVYILIKEALKLIRSSIPSTIVIKEEIVSRAVVMADAGQIHQVIMNLCTNAYQAMHETGGVLTVELKETDIPVQEMVLGLNIKPGKYVKLTVSDTGQGIDDRIMDKIFDPYFTTKDPDKGTGLGLAVVHGIVKEHKGYITVTSKKGRGTCFYVFLPVSMRRPVSQHSENMAADLNIGTEKIMVVDDEESIRNSSAGFLEDRGYEIRVFENGEQALKAFETDPFQFDLIITDMTMPVMTGDELARNILKIRPGTPIILCSGYSEKISNVKVKNIGIQKVLQKPVNFEDLLKAIRDIFAESKTG